MHCLILTRMHFLGPTVNPFSMKNPKIIPKLFKNFLNFYSSTSKHPKGLGSDETVAAGVRPQSTVRHHLERTTPTPGKATPFCFARRKTKWREQLSQNILKSIKIFFFSKCYRLDSTTNTA